jgi:hypothetical protein
MLLRVSGLTNEDFMESPATAMNVLNFQQVSLERYDLCLLHEIWRDSIAFTSTPVYDKPMPKGVNIDTALEELVRDDDPKVYFEDMTKIGEGYGQKNGLHGR